MQLHIYNSVDEVIAAMADHFVKVVGGKERCNVVLSGGGSPKKLYELLASPAYRDKINWAAINFFFGDERFVPADDPGYNGLMVKKALFEPLQIPPQQIFYIETNGTPQEAAGEYEERIKNVEFDLVLLGLGDNSHTASLFPHTPVLHEQHARVKEVFIKDKNSWRITLTAPVINNSKNICFLVYGEAKADAVKAVLQGPKDIEEHPAQLITSNDWFMDAAAASKL